MKRFLILLFVLMFFFLFGCNRRTLTKTNAPDSSTVSSKESSSTLSAEIVFIGVPSQALTAELGEKCDIPEVTAKKGKTNVEVSVAVFDSNNQSVEVLGRGTRFIADSLNGYKIVYTATLGDESKTAEVLVNVSDNKGPEATFDQTVDNLCIEKGTTFTLPIATWSDNGGVVKDESVSVKFNNTDVTLTNNSFTAAEYGTYVITYSAKDGNDNPTTINVNVDCLRTIVLYDFEDMSGVWVGTTTEIVSDYAVKGNALKIENNNESWTMIAVYPPYYDLSGFDRFQISVYASVDVDTSDNGFYLLNQKVYLSQGLNTITFTKEEFDAQYPDGIIPSKLPLYDSYPFIWFQFKAANATIYVDNFIGIFENFETDTVGPVISFGPTVTNNKITITEGDVITIPTPAAYDNSVETIAVTYKVFDGETDITEDVNLGSVTASLSGDYKIVYEAKDSANNITTKTITIEVEEAEFLFYPTKNDYDVLQDFEDVSAIDTYFFPTSEGLTTTNALDGNAYHITGDASWAKLPVLMKKNGELLTSSDFDTYESYRLYIYSAGAATFAFLNKTYSLVAGKNLIELSKEDMLTQLASNPDCYPSNGYFFCQLNGVGLDLYFDELIGIYPEGYDTNPIPEEVENYLPTDREYDVLQDFESTSALDIWFFPGSDLSTAYAISGHSYNITGDANWAKLPMLMKKDGHVLTSADWNLYDYFKLCIYSKTDGITFAFLNKTYSLTIGYNIITITKTEMVEIITSRDDCYPETGYFWCQVNGNGANLYFDELLGVYPEGYVRPIDPNDPVANFIPTDREYDVLQSFDEAGCVDTYFFPESEGLTTDHALSGNSFHVSGDGNWSKLPVIMKKNGAVLTSADWNAYESFKLYIYSETTGNFYFLNKGYSLAEGNNVIEISKEDMLTQLDLNADCYTETGYFWCQLHGAGLSLYLDQMIGIYPEG